MTLAMAVIYLLAVRLIDFNEKEPLWAVLLFFALGGGAAVVLHASTSSVFLEIGVAGVLVKELVRFLAIGAGVAALVAVGRSRGYLEINGLLDGVVYGSAGGLGFAIGAVFARDMLDRTTVSIVQPSVLGWGQVALVGSSDGVYGAFMGIGFAAAISLPSQVARALAPLCGYASAAVAHVSYEVVAHGDTIGDAGMMRRWLATLLPLLIVAVVMILALGRERRAIADELSSEAVTGAVSADELALLKSGVRRELSYLKVLVRGQLGQWSALHGLHNRQVQLALAKQRAMGEKDEQRRAGVAEEIARLRSAVLDIKRALGIQVSPASSEPQPAADAAAHDETTGGKVA
jgi:hypothetical protein